MSTAAGLPPTMRARLQSLARRIRLLRAVRGLSLLFLVLLATATVAFLSDALLTLPVWLRSLVLASWVMVGAWLAYRVVLQPLRRPLDGDALAALVEEKYPDLGERL